MSVTYLKTASKTPETETDTARKVAGDMIAAIEADGEAAVRRYAQELDHWNGPILMDDTAIAARLVSVTPAVRADIDTAIGSAAAVSY
jgi:sulfopropanediol 3-dehydrogenase